MLLEQTESSLLVVDVQERLLPAMATPNEIMAPIQLLLRAAATLGVPVLASEQYPQGLGRTVPPIRDLISKNQIVEKIEFSCAANPNLRRRLLDFGGEQLVLCGIEAHVCVLQTALGFAGDTQVFVVADAVDSRRPESRSLALRRMERAGIELVTAEMVVFEWLGRAGTPEFKELSALLK